MKPPPQNATERTIGFLGPALILAAGIWVVADRDAWWLMSVVWFGMALTFLGQFSYSRRLGRSAAVPYIAFAIEILLGQMVLLFVGLDRSLGWLVAVVVVIMVFTVTLSVLFWRRLRPRHLTSRAVAPRTVR